MGIKMVINFLRILQVRKFHNSQPLEVQCPQENDHLIDKGFPVLVKMSFLFLSKSFIIIFYDVICRSTQLYYHDGQVLNDMQYSYYVVVVPKLLQCVVTKIGCQLFYHVCKSSFVNTPSYYVVRSTVVRKQPPKFMHYASARPIKLEM